MRRTWTSAVIRLLSITFSDIVEVFYQCVNDARHSLREHIRNNNQLLSLNQRLIQTCLLLLISKSFVIKFFELRSLCILSYVCLRETIILIEDEKIQPSQGRTFTQLRSRIGA